MNLDNEAVEVGDYVTVRGWRFVVKRVHPPLDGSDDPVVWGKPVDAVGKPIEAERWYHLIAYTKEPKGQALLQELRAKVEAARREYNELRARLDEETARGPRNGEGEGE